MSTGGLNTKDSSRVLSQLDKKIRSLVKSKVDFEQREHDLKAVATITKEDFIKMDHNDELTKIKAIQREKLLEDMTQIVNDKIRELEKQEKENKEKEQVLKELSAALLEKVRQLEKEKARADELNSKLEETVKKLTEAERELKIERDWLAEQVEKKSIEVLDTIDQLIHAENNKSIQI